MKWVVTFWAYSTSDMHTICPRNLDPFYIVSYYMKRFKTSWTYSMPMPSTLLFVLEERHSIMLCTKTNIEFWRIFIVRRYERRRRRDAKSRRDTAGLPTSTAAHTVLFDGRQWRLRSVNTGQFEYFYLIHLLVSLNEFSFNLFGHLYMLYTVCPGSSYPILYSNLLFKMG